MLFHHYLVVSALQIIFLVIASAQIIVTAMSLKFSILKKKTLNKQKGGILVSYI